MKTKNKRRLRTQKGQSVAELAIMGSLMLFAFATLLTYGQRFEAQQQAKQEAFRRALARAYSLNSAVTYTLKKDTRFINLFGGYGEGQASSVGGSASVMWVKGAPGRSGSGDNSFSIYRINNEEVGDPETGLPRIEKEVKTHTGDKSDVTVPVGIWKEEVQKATRYGSASRRGEDATLINNTQVSDLQETVNTTLYARYDQSQNDPNAPPGSIPPVYADMGSYGPYRQGAYYRGDINRIEYRNDTVGTTIHKERTWRTNH